MYATDRNLRLRTLDTLYGALEPLTPVLAHCYDSLVADRLVDDRLRSYEGPMAQRNLANEVETEAVDAMMAAIESRHDIAHRWYRRKAELLGLERLHLADQYAPLGEGRSFPYEESREIVRKAFARFSGDIEQVSEAFFTGQRVDAEPRQGKRGGAFCASVAQDADAFIMLNYTDRLRDVMTMAHELGHGMHFTLSAQRQSALSFHPGIALAEVPSTFAELVTFDYLMETEQEPSTRSALVRQELESSFATVFRQTMMARYESDAYAARGENRTLTPDRLSEMWLDPTGTSTATRSSPRRLPARLELHPALHQHPLLHVRVRVRAPREPGPVRDLARAGRELRAAVPRVPGAGRCRVPRRPAGSVRDRPDRRGHVAPGAGRDGAAAAAGPGGLSRAVPGTPRADRRGRRPRPRRARDVSPPSGRRLCTCYHLFVAAGCRVLFAHERAEPGVPASETRRARTEPTLPVCGS